MAEQSRRPFEGKDLMEAKGKGTLKAKALRWQKQGYFEGKCPLMAKGRALYFEGKSPSMARAKALRSQREGHFEGKGPSMAKAWAL